MQGCETWTTPPPSGWRAGLWDRVLRAVRLARLARLEARLLRWMEARGHMATVHLSINVIEAIAGAGLLAGELVAFAGREDASGLPVVLRVDYVPLTQRC